MTDIIILAPYTKGELEWQTLKSGGGAVGHFALRHQFYIAWRDYSGSSGNLPKGFFPIDGRIVYSPSGFEGTSGMPKDLHAPRVMWHFDLSTASGQAGWRDAINKIENGFTPNPADGVDMPSIHEAREESRREETSEAGENNESESGGSQNSSTPGSNPSSSPAPTAPKDEEEEEPAPDGPPGNSLYIPVVIHGDGTTTDETSPITRFPVILQFQQGETWLARSLSEPEESAFWAGEALSP